LARDKKWDAKNRNGEKVAEKLRVRIGITTKNRPEYRAYGAGIRREARGKGGEHE
jgi:hypothetical protein